MSGASNKQADSVAAADDERQEGSAAAVTHWLPHRSSAGGGGAPGDGNDDSDDSDDEALSEIDCLCLGTGRFLRSVLVPALVGSGFRPALVQPRGRGFVDYMAARQQGGGESAGTPSSSSSSSYPVDTVLPSGEVRTDSIRCYGAFSLAKGDVADCRAAFLEDCLPRMKGPPRIFGIGVTEAGLASHKTRAMRDLYEILSKFEELSSSGAWKKQGAARTCILDMDNVPENGSVVRRHMLALAEEDEASSKGEAMRKFLDERVSFHDTMVDRITSQRENSGGMVPRCEPTPAKALVALDADGHLPEAFRKISSPAAHLGVVVRETPEQLKADISLKLRVANGTHTAIAHLLALLGLEQTNDGLSAGTGNGSSGNGTSNLLMGYLDALFEGQILPGAVAGLRADCGMGEDVANAEAEAAYADWRTRLTHPHFGLSAFFITQNGAAKGGIRLGPTVSDLVTKCPGAEKQQQQQPVSVVMAYAFAVLLRWLTPGSNKTAAASATEHKDKKSKPGIFRGWLQPSKDPDKSTSDAKTPGENGGQGTVEYADQLRYNIREGWYEFRCACQVTEDDTKKERNLSEWLGEVAGQDDRQPAAYVPAVRAYLSSPDGGNLGASIGGRPEFEALVQAVATLLARMVAGDDLLALLREMSDGVGPCGKGYATGCQALVDGGGGGGTGAPLHHRDSPVPDGASALANEPHYLVAEYFVTAPASVTPEAFYAKAKKDQADIIWRSLFVDRSPVSEACRGVITTLLALGLHEEVRSRDLDAVRAFYQKYRKDGLAGAERFSDLVFKTSGVRYNIMTNIPFDPNEVCQWRPKRKEYPRHYRSALRVDPLLSGDRSAIEDALKASGYELSLEGARQYLRDWCDTMKPEYMMASTPHDFVLKEGTVGTVSSGRAASLNEDALSQPGAFVDVVMSDATQTCTGVED